MFPRSQDGKHRTEAAQLHRRNYHPSWLRAGARLPHEVVWLPLYLLHEGATPLLGGEWLRELHLDWGPLHSMIVESPRSAVFLMDKYKYLFREELGTISCDKASLTLKEDSSPRFLKAGNLPFALKPAIEKKLDKLELLSVITLITTSSFATSIVPVVKKNKSIRVCVDYISAIDQVLQVSQCSLPRLDEIFAVFSKLDLSRAYAKSQWMRSLVNTSNLTHTRVCVSTG